jgi:hypothetical protein
VGKCVDASIIAALKALQARKISRPARAYIFYYPLHHSRCWAAPFFSWLPAQWHLSGSLTPLRLVAILDEITEMGADTQSNLLRAVQEQAVRLVGATREGARAIQRNRRCDDLRHAIAHQIGGPPPSITSFERLKANEL